MQNTVESLWRGVFALVFVMGCPAEDESGDSETMSVSETGAAETDTQETGEESGTAPGTASSPITEGDCLEVGLGCSAGECCPGLVCEAGSCNDPSCSSTGEVCESDADCCAGLCRQDGVCGVMECAPEGGDCEAGCCDELPCDQNTLECSSTCAVLEAPCGRDEDCCEQACFDGFCVGQG